MEASDWMPKFFIVVTIVGECSRRVIWRKTGASAFLACCLTVSCKVAGCVSNGTSIEATPVSLQSQAPSFYPGYGLSHLWNVKLYWSRVHQLSHFGRSKMKGNDFTAFPIFRQEGHAQTDDSCSRSGSASRRQILQWFGTEVFCSSRVFFFFFSASICSCSCSI